MTGYAQYDIAGNVVKAVDGRGYATLLDFSDRFGAPDGDARANLNAAGQYSYAFNSTDTWQVYGLGDELIAELTESQRIHYLETRRIIPAHSQNFAKREELSTVSEYSHDNRLLTIRYGLVRRRGCLPGCCYLK